MSRLLGRPVITPPAPGDNDKSIADLRSRRDAVEAKVRGWETFVRRHRGEYNEANSQHSAGAAVRRDTAHQREQVAARALDVLASSPELAESGLNNILFVAQSQFRDERAINDDAVVANDDLVPDVDIWGIGQLAPR